MKANKEITIIGATGNIGKPVTLFLAQMDFRVKVIARNPEKAKVLFGNEPNISICYGDLKDLSSLKSALKGTVYLYLNLSTMTTDMDVPFAPEREGIRNILDSIDVLTIKQIIVISGMGAFQKNIVPEKYQFAPNKIRSQGHELLKDSGIPYTILHCSWFADSFVTYQRNGAYPVVGYNKAPIFFINAYDYTCQLVNAVGNPSAFYKEYPMQGRQGIDHMKAAREFLDEYSSRVKVQKMPTIIISIMSLFKSEMKVLKAMAKYFRNSREEFQAVEYKTYSDLGEPKLSLKQYAQKLKDSGIYQMSFS